MYTRESLTTYHLFKKIQRPEETILFHIRLKRKLFDFPRKNETEKIINASIKR